MHDTTDSPDIPEPQTKAPSAWEGAFAAFSDAWTQVRRNPAPALVIMLSYVIVDLIGRYGGVNEMLPYHRYVDLTDALTLVFLLAMPTYALAIADKRKLSIGDMLRIRPLTYIFVLLATIAVAAIIFFSILLLIFPVIWTLAWFYLGSYAVVDKDMSPPDALAYSKELAQDHKSKVWGVFGATLLMAIAASLFNVLPVIGKSAAIAAAAMMSILAAGASAILYRWLQRQASNRSDDLPE